MALKFDMSKNNWQDMYMQQMAMQSPTSTYTAGKNIGEGLGLLGTALHEKYGPAQKEYKEYSTAIDSENILLPKKERKMKLPFKTWKSINWTPKKEAERKVKREERRENRKETVSNILGGTQDLLNQFGETKLGKSLKNKPWETVGTGLVGGGLVGGIVSAMSPQMRVGSAGLGALGYVLSQVLDPEDLKKGWNDVKDKFAGLPDDIKSGLKEKYNDIKSSKNLLESDIRSGNFDKLTPWNDEWVRGLLEKKKAKALAKKNIKDKTFMWNDVAYPTKEAQQNAREEQSIRDIIARNEAKKKVNLQNRGIVPSIQSKYLPQPQTPDELYRRKLGLPALPHPGYGTKEYQQNIGQEYLKNPGQSVASQLWGLYPDAPSVNPNAPLLNPNLNTAPEIINEEDYDLDYVPFSGNEGIY